MDNSPLKELEEKVQQLLKKYQRLQKENEKLKADIASATRELAISKNQIATLKQEVDVKHLNVQHLPEEDKKELSNRINGYIKEIDHCLQLLNS